MKAQSLFPSDVKDAGSIFYFRLVITFPSSALSVAKTCLHISKS